MPDLLFADPRLAALYDDFDGPRGDLDAYLSLIAELGSRSVLDVGCGTGSLACLLSARGLDVIGTDPARASLEIARSKPHADRVRWLLGTATALPADVVADAATMTGNVAQVFLTDEAWTANLRAIRRALAPGGHLIFEARDPRRQAWLRWNRAETWRRLTIPGRGAVEGWCDVLEVRGERVRFRWTYRFEDGEILTSDSTLRFRGEAALVRSLEATGYEVIDTRDAPDRPGEELVFVARVDADPPSARRRRAR